MEKMSLYELYRILENVRSSDYKFETIEFVLIAGSCQE